MLYKSRIMFLCLNISAQTIEEVQLENKVVYWHGDVISLTEVDIAAATALQQIFSS